MRPFIPYRRRRDLPEKFTRQKPLGAYIADFYCSAGRLVIEVDGDSHFTCSAAEHDRARTAALERDGVRIMRFTNEDVLQRFEGACGRIVEFLRG